MASNSEINALWIYVVCMLLGTISAGPIQVVISFIVLDRIKLKIVVYFIYLLLFRSHIINAHLQVPKIHGEKFHRVVIELKYICLV